MTSEVAERQWLMFNQKITMRLVPISSIDTTTPTPLYQQYERIVGKSWEEQQDWVQSWDAKGYAPAIYLLGLHFKKREQYVHAFNSFRKAANLGYAEAQFHLVQCYNNGLGVDINSQKAGKWLIEAAMNGHVEAQYELGKCYIEGLKYGIEDDYNKAVEWFLKAADQGYGRAFFELAQCYRNGFGVDRDLSKAAEWLTKGAKLGDIWSQYTLGEYYEQGFGVDRDYKKAIEWYIKAAEQGSSDAKVRLLSLSFHGIIYKQGGEKGREWLSKEGLIPQSHKLVAQREEKKRLEEEQRRKEEEERQRAEEEKRLAEEKRIKEEEERQRAEEEKRLAEEKRIKEEEENRKEQDRLEAAKKEKERITLEFEKFASELFSKRAEAKSTGFLWSKSHVFEILTTPLTVNIYNSFKSRAVVNEPDGERLLDQYKDKQVVKELIEMMEDVFSKNHATFSIPSVSETVGAQTSQLIGKKGLYLVVHFPDFN